MTGVLDPLLCAVALTAVYGLARYALTDPICPRCERPLRHQPHARVWRCDGCGYARRAAE